MFGLFREIKSFIKLPKVWIDHWVFRLHYKVTFIILLGSAALVTAKQYLGDPIDCIVEEIPQNVMDTYCWIHSTFSIPGSDLGKEGYDVAHPGVGSPPDDQDTEDSFRYHKYYQWVTLTLFFQALLFYLPHYIWKYLEDGKMQLLAGGLAIPIIDENTKNDRLTSLVDYLKRNKGKHTWYAYKFFLCEFLNLVNIVGQIFFTDLFLGGEFSKYGSEVISISEKDLSDRGDPMDRVFPKVAKCTFHKFGPSGTIEKFDGLCILPLNIINEKIYIFLWFWFIFVSIITIVYFVIQLAVFFSSSFRDYILTLQGHISDQRNVKRLLQDYPDLGDWFLLHLFALNIDPFIFDEFVLKTLGKKEDEKVENNGKINDDGEGIITSVRRLDKKDRTANAENIPLLVKNPIITNALLNATTEPQQLTIYDRDKTNPDQILLNPQQASTNPQQTIQNFQQASTNLQQTLPNIQQASRNQEEDVPEKEQGHAEESVTEKQARPAQLSTGPQVRDNKGPPAQGYTGPQVRGNKGPPAQGYTGPQVRGNKGPPAQGYTGPQVRGNKGPPAQRSTGPEVQPTKAHQPSAAQVHQSRAVNNKKPYSPGAINGNENRIPPRPPKKII